MLQVLLTALQIHFPNGHSKKHTLIKLNCSEIKTYDSMLVLLFSSEHRV